jgi:hypothetical protein
LSGSSAGYGRSSLWRWALGLLLLTGCARPVEPTATTVPTPDEVTRYIAATERYTSYAAIGYINDMFAVDANSILRALQAIEPPEQLEALHEQALSAYRHIYEGKLLLPGAGSELRAEGFFMIEWGIGRLLEYRQELDRLRR